ncbi:hypothetical protein ACH4RG_22890 [Streptomyces sp. NPDC021019]|uniref:hypothetical protein n=1 Tax=Streptomyces sp. NPDC021019 TaxID=3365108 RepID=UPI0037A43838
MTNTGDTTRAAIVGLQATVAERMIASGHWLLDAAPSARRARLDWIDRGTTFLTPGPRFGAIIVQASVMHAALLLDNEPERCAARLPVGLRGGPIYYAKQQFGREAGYVALVPASVAMEWNVPGSVAHRPQATLDVPAPNNTSPDHGPAWWLTPPEGPGELCDPGALATLSRHGHGVLTGTLGKRP